MSEYNKIMENYVNNLPIHDEITNYDHRLRFGRARIQAAKSLVESNFNHTESWTNAWYNTAGWRGENKSEKLKIYKNLVSGRGFVHMF